jgi:hypothetical protein
MQKDTERYRAVLERIEADHRGHRKPQRGRREHTAQTKEDIEACF